MFFSWCLTSSESCYSKADLEIAVFFSSITSQINILNIFIYFFMFYIIILKRKADPLPWII